MNDILKQSLEMLGLPVIEQEPEVIQATLSRIRCNSLAAVFVAHLNATEPGFKATRDESSVRVRDCDGNVMSFTITEGERLSEKHRRKAA